MGFRPLAGISCNKEFNKSAYYREFPSPRGDKLQRMKAYKGFDRNMFPSPRGDKLQLGQLANLVTVGAVSVPSRG